MHGKNTATKIKYKGEDWYHTHGKVMTLLNMWKYCK